MTLISGMHFPTNREEPLKILRGTGQVTVEGGHQLR